MVGDEVACTFAGAVRLGKPAKIVFVGKKGNNDGHFLGWGHPVELLPYLLEVDPQYALSYYTALSADRQWQLVEPPPTKVQPPIQIWMKPDGLAPKHPWMAFDNVSGLPNPFLAEQLLAADIGEKVENKLYPKPNPTWISPVRVVELFRPRLYTKTIDENWSEELQLNALFEPDADYVALTQNGKYKAIVSRLSLLGELVKTMVKQK
ncbi:MAG: hypothetical protein IPM82_11935 [Saprospiraceae bacterium]|nr:hypothetical protein [Saprospiraceae bacterium]